LFGAIRIGSCVKRLPSGWGPRLNIQAFDLNQALSQLNYSAIPFTYSGVFCYQKNPDELYIAEYVKPTVNLVCLACRQGLTNVLGNYTLYYTTEGKEEKAVSLLHTGTTADATYVGK